MNDHAARGWALAIVAIISATAVAQLPAPADRGPNQDRSRVTQLLLERVPSIEDFDLMFLTVDALPPGRLGCYGSTDPQSSPRIDDLAARSIVFERAYSSSPHRLTGLLSLLKSQYPGTMGDPGNAPASGSIVTQLADRGFRTFASFRPKVLESMGEPVGAFSPSLDFDRRWWNRSNDPARRIEMFEKAIGYRRRGEQLFGFFHFDQSYPPVNQRHVVNWSTDPTENHRSAIKRIDREIGSLIGRMEKLGLMESTIIVLTSPHGLARMPLSSSWQQNDLTDASLHVPLVVYIPGLEPRRIGTPVETIDISPSVLSLLNRDCDYSVQGRSFLDLILHAAPPDGTMADRTTFAEHRAFAAETEELVAMSVARGKHRLVLRPGLGQVELFDRDRPNAGDVSELEPEIVASLRAEMDDIRVYNDACTRLWSHGEQRAPRLEGTAGLAARALWLSDLGDPRAREVVLNLLRRADGDQLEAVELLLEAGTPEDADIAEGFLTHEDSRLQALAGAFLARCGQVEKGLDFAIQGLNVDMPASRLLAIFDAISGTGSPAALAAIQSFVPEEGNYLLTAGRDLALARLGDPEAGRRLPAHILEPRASFSKKPFIENLVEREGEQAVGILTLCLTDGDRSPRTVLEVFSALEKLDGRSADRAVAEHLDHSSSKVRTRAASILARWNSLAGYPGLLDLLGDEGFRFRLGVRRLLNHSSLVGSPLVDGIRFDHWSLRHGASLAERKDGLPNISSRTLEFRLGVRQPETRRFALAFRLDDPAQAERGLQLTVKVNQHPGRAKKILAEEFDGTWIWVGELPVGSLEAGTNQFAIRLRDVDRKVVSAWGLAMAFLPDRTVERQPLAAVETHSLVDRVQRADSRRGRLDGDLQRYHLWYQATGLVDGATVGRQVVVKIEGQVAARLDLAPGHSGGSVRIQLPPSAHDGSAIELICPPDLAKLGGRVNLVVYGSR